MRPNRITQKRKQLIVQLKDESFDYNEIAELLKISRRYAIRIYSQWRKENER